MNETNNAALVIAFAAVALLLLFGGGMTAGRIVTGGMAESASMGGMGLAWLPVLLVVALGVVLIPGFSAKK